MQSAQAAFIEVAAAFATYFPAGQFEQEVEPSLMANLPNSQSAQIEAPLSENLPIGHVMQSCAELWALW